MCLRLILRILIIIIMRTPLLPRPSPSLAPAPRNRFNLSFGGSSDFGRLAYASLRAPPLPPLLLLLLRTCSLPILAAVRMSVILLQQKNELVAVIAQFSLVDGSSGLLRHRFV